MRTKFFRKTALVIALITLIGIISTAVLFICFIKSPKFVALDFTRLNNAKSNITMLDRYGNRIDEAIYLDKYKQTDITKLHDYTLDAFVSVEDKRFYKHSGVDLRRIVAAAVNNVRTGTLKEGASTITQQLIKNTHLDNKKTFIRKLNEIVLAKQLEQRLSKDEILQIYLNTVYFGKNAYGIETASRLYFEKDAKDLTLSQSAVLAGMLKAPNNYSPLVDIHKCINRRNVVLKTMLDNGYIDAEAYQTAKDEEIVVANSGSFGIETDYVYQALQEVCKLLDLSQLQALNSKLTIYTNYDPLCQQALEYSVKSNTNSSFCAVVCNNDNCGVAAYYAKGRNATDKRQVGSTIKPFGVYAPALEEGKITLSSPVLDEKTSFAGYSPKNFGDKYVGWTNVKNSISKSLNIPAVKVLNSVGVDTASKYIGKMGVENAKKQQNLSMSLGNVNGGMDMCELAQCYLTLANYGKYQEIAFVEQIDNKFGTIYKRKQNKKEVFSEETAYLVTDALIDVSKNGTGRTLAGLDFEVAAKTGTVGDAQGNTDAIVCGYTTEQTYCIWLTNENKSNFTGGGEPVNVLNNYLQIKCKNKAPCSFEVPSKVVKIAIDKEQLSKHQREYAASSLDSEKNKQYFYYKMGTEPTEQRLDTEIDFEIEVNENNYVVINCKRDADLRYVLERNCEKQALIELSSDRYVDNIVEMGKQYSYTIHAYFGDKLIASSKTTKIVVPNSSKHKDGQTDEQSIWDRLKNLLYVD
ncbi:MAG: penicillin-binding protein [Clostridia bacterium]|nr:penicillin-binding protein [Clostridia bacterium]